MLLLFIDIYLIFPSSMACLCLGTKPGLGGVPSNYRDNIVVVIISRKERRGSFHYKSIISRVIIIAEFIIYKITIIFLFVSCMNDRTRQYSFGNITQHTANTMEYITNQKGGIILKYKSFLYQK